MSYSVPYSFIPGTKARAQDVNANFNSVTDYLELLDASKVNNDLSNISAEGVNLIKNNSSRRNIGELIYTLIPLQDANLHLLDGTLLYSGVYSDFIDYIANLYAENPSANYFCTESDWQSSVSTYGVCGKFVYDSTNNTVRLPKVTGKIDGTTDINALGDLEPLFVKLPNITGWHQEINHYTYWDNSGAFTGTRLSTFDGTERGSDYGGRGLCTISLDASRSSSVYSGNGSDTAIHEQAIKCFIYIVIATSSKTEIQTDIDEVVTDLNNKMDRDCLNASDTGNIQMAKASMPSNTYVDLTLGASGSTYTAPANGWFYFTIQTTNSNSSYFGIFNTSNNMRDGKWTTLGSANIASYMPARKGDVIEISYTNGTPISDCRFIYAQGSESEAQ